MEEFKSKLSQETEGDTGTLSQPETAENPSLVGNSEDTELSAQDSISEPVMRALASALTTIEEYVPTKWVDNTEPDIDAAHLNHAEQAIMRVTSALNGAIGAINELNNATNNATLKTYTPTFYWSDGSQYPTVSNIITAYSTMAKICWIEARYNITSLGNPSTNSNFVISLPSGITPLSSTTAMLSMYQSDAVSSMLGIRTSKTDKTLYVINGIGGGYSSKHIPTGYQGFSVMFMIE